MTSPENETALGEWRHFWTLPVAAMLGYSTIGLCSFGLGPFVAPIEREFGWTRADVMIGLSLSSFIGIFLSIIVGMIVDRFGPRRVGLTGLFVKTGAFALLGTATGTLLNWSMLWIIIAVGVVLVQSTVWTSAVASRFDRSRGFAMAVALSGSSIAAAVLPLFATWLIELHGWRTAFAGVAAAWAAVALPMVFFFFRGRHDLGGSRQQKRVEDPPQLPGLSLREGIRTRAFLCLLISFGAFSFYSIAIAANLVPQLREVGLTTMNAAGVASIMGLVGIAARLSVGLLLDRLPANIIGAISQMMPVVGCTIFLMEDPGVLLLSLAVASFGIATGAEMDVALYLASRSFGLKAFAALFGVIITIGSIIAATAPYATGWLHDRFGNYDSLMMAIMIVMTIGAAAIASIGRSPGRFASPGH